MAAECELRIERNVENMIRGLLAILDALGVWRVNKEESIQNPLQKVSVERNVVGINVLESTKESML